jgi:hypothetical protein
MLVFVSVGADLQARVPQASADASARCESLGRAIPIPIVGSVAAFSSRIASAYRPARSWSIVQNRPTVRPSASMSTPVKLGTLPSPGIRCMSPQSTTTKPAPALGTTPRTGSR